MRSRKSTVCGECWNIKCRLGWKSLSAVKKDCKVLTVSVHIIKMSSMYRVSRSGCVCCVLRNLSSIADIKMLAMVGEKAAPMAVPLIC